MENLEPKETGKIRTGDWGLGTGEEFSQSRQFAQVGKPDHVSSSSVLNHVTCFPTQDDTPLPSTGGTPAQGWLRNAVAPQYQIANEDTNTPKIQLILYLIPVIGFFPSLWTLYRRQGSREQLATSRLSITLASAWLLGYLLLATGAATSDLFTLRLFILNSFLTSGYFLINVWLIIRLLQGRSRRIPGFSNFAERMLGKYLS